MRTSNTFIVNPAAGFGKTKKILKTLLKEIHTQHRKSTVEITHHPLHAISLTKDAIKKGAERLIVIGGDGTLNEVVNGYFAANGKPHNEHVSIAIIPSGTGSDFARSIGQEEDLAKAIDFASKADAKKIDVGLVEAKDTHGLAVSRYFLNVSSMGLSGLVAGFMKTITKKFGSKGAYFLSTVQAIRTFKPPTLLIRGDGMEKIINKCSLISVANGKFFGSGMKIAPEAMVDDGKFDVITIQNLGALFFLINGYRVYQGTHIELDNVNMYRQTECVVESLSKEPVYIETDGELFAELPAKYSIKHKILPFVRYDI
jgi:diacylglycerol kinase (ATP)